MATHHGLMNEFDRYERLAQLLRDFRASAALTQTEVATALGKPQSYVSKYESGERRLDLVELAEICPVLGITLTDFAQAFERKHK